MPRHDILRDVLALEYLVPSDNRLAVSACDIGRITRHIALQLRLRRRLVGCLYAEFGDTRLTIGTLLPAVLRALVAADMDKLRRKKLHHLRQDITDKLHGHVFTGTQYILVARPGAKHLVRPAGAAEFGIRGQRGHHVRRQVDLWNDLYMVLGGISDDVAYLILRIEAFDRDGVDLRARAVAAYQCAGAL